MPDLSRNIVCLGVSHQTASVDIREKFAVSPGHMHEVLGEFTRIEGVDEAVIVSTCNRVEFYASGENLKCSHRAFNEFLEMHSGMQDAGMEIFYRYDFPHSVEHLFRVACGMESMVTGETEILGQVKQAYATACECGTSAKTLNRLFQKTFHTAKQVRSRTGINKGSVSVGSVAVDLAGKIFGKLHDCSVMIVGAGENSERTARSLISRGVKSILVANRSPERAMKIAEAMNGRAVPLEKWETEIAEIDILIASTSAPHPIINREKLEPLMKGRSRRPLFIIDIAVPRDVSPDANEIENVYLFDIDSLQSIARKSIEERQLQVVAGEEIIREHVTEFGEWMHAQKMPVNNNGIRAERGGEEISTESTA